MSAGLRIFENYWPWVDLNALLLMLLYLFSALRAIWNTSIIAVFFKGCEFVCFEFCLDKIQQLRMWPLPHPTPQVSLKQRDKSSWNQRSSVFPLASLKFSICGWVVAIHKTMLFPVFQFLAGWFQRKKDDVWLKIYLDQFFYKESPTIAYI